ncbi:MAG: hypothetical protein AB1414_01095 [bacterium]
MKKIMAIKTIKCVNPKGVEVEISEVWFEDHGKSLGYQKKGEVKVGGPKEEKVETKAETEEKPKATRGRPKKK